MARRCTTEEFIQRSKEKYGNDEFDYSKVVYKNQATPVLLTCKNGHIYEQTPKVHLRKNNTTKCYICVRNDRTHTTEYFIEKAKELHGDSYNYDKVDYKTSNTNVIIGCNKCGDIFNQTPLSHLKGSGCIKCVNKAQTFTKEEFIDRARKIHGDLYNYDEVDYKGIFVKVTIKCKNGHTFSQPPTGHLKGNGCRKCYTNTIRVSEDYFIKRSKDLYGDSFNYDNLNFVDINTPITLTCKNGHTITQLPQSHLRNGVCRECNGKLPYDRESFIKKSKEIHGEDTFDYSDVKFLNIKTGIWLTCRNGHKFKQFPFNHLRGMGCKKCSDKLRTFKPTEEFFIGKPTILYYIKFEENNVYKIGITTRSTKTRFNGETQPYKIIKEWLFENGEDALKVEQEYHDRFKEFRYITTDFLKNGGNNELYYTDVLSLDK